MLEHALVVGFSDEFQRIKLAQMELVKEAIGIAALRGAGKMIGKRLGPAVSGTAKTIPPPTAAARQSFAPSMRNTRRGSVEPGVAGMRKSFANVQQANQQLGGAKSVLKPSAFEGINRQLGGAKSILKTSAAPAGKAMKRMYGQVTGSTAKQGRQPYLKRRVEPPSEPPVSQFKTSRPPPSGVTRKPTTIPPPPKAPSAEEMAKVTGDTAKRAPRHLATFTKRGSLSKQAVTNKWIAEKTMGAIKKGPLWKRGITAGGGGAKGMQKRLDIGDRFAGRKAMRMAAKDTVHQLRAKGPVDYVKRVAKHQQSPRAMETGQAIFSSPQGKRTMENIESVGKGLRGLKKQWTG